MYSQEICEKVVKIAKQALSSGLVLEKSGNFSIYDREQNVVYITPSGVYREVLDASQIVIVDMDNNHLAGNGKASSETLVHLEIYKARPDVNAVAHTHSVYATAHAVANKPIEPWVVETLLYGGRVEVAPFAIPGTMELAKSAAETLGEKNAVLLQHHGVVCVGRDLDEAFLNALYLEDTAKICHIASQMGSPQALPEEVIQTIIAKLKSM